MRLAVDVTDGTLLQASSGRSSGGISSHGVSLSRDSGSKAGNEGDGETHVGGCRVWTEVEEAQVVCISSSEVER